MFDFFKRAIDTTSEEVISDWGKRSKNYRTVSFDKQFDGVDTSLFRSDIDPQKNVHICMSVLDGLANNLKQRVSNLRMDEIDYDALMDKSNEYFEIMRKYFYKEEK